MPLRAIQKTVGREIEGFVKDKLGIKDKSKNAFGPSGTVLSYPEDLFDPSGKYGQNYTTFSIILDASDRIVREGGAAVAVPSRLTTLQKAAGATNISTGVLGAGIGGALGALGGSLGGFLGKGGVVGAVAGLFGGKKAAELAMSGRNVQLEGIIALYTPNDLQVSYATQFEEDSYATFDQVTDMAVNAVGNMGQVISGGKNLATAVKQAGNDASDTIAQQLNKIGAINRATRTVFNPKVEQLFKGVDLRTFSMTYQFSPKSKSEAEDVMKIIFYFKRFMLPDTVGGADGKLLFTYPALFDIQHCKGSEGNPNLFKMNSCILTNITTNYTPHALFSTFEDGIPTSINMTLTFKETRALVRKDIEEGF